MIVCGDDALAHRLAAELREVYRARVTLVRPSSGSAGRPRLALTRQGRAAALLGRVSTAVTGGSPGPAAAPSEVEADEPTEEVLESAGVAGAAALALVYDDDETNIHAALAARRLNPELRLVIRLYNRRLGQHLEQLLDQAAMVALPDADAATIDASTTVLSDADTAAPALAATAVAGTSKVVHADGLLLRAVERTPSDRAGADTGLCTLALLSATVNDPAGEEGSDSSGTAGPQLLPAPDAIRAATGRGAIVLETVSHTRPASPSGRLAGRGRPLAELFSRRLRWAVAVTALAVLALAVVSWLITGDHLLHAAYVTLLNLFSINDPALGESTARQVLQLLTGLVGLVLLPLLVAGALEALGAFRSASALRRPPRGLSGHVVLLGLGKIGTRVLAQLRDLEIPVVCVEESPEARGVALARRLRVPTVIGDVTQEGVLEAAKVHRAHSLLALTSSDTTNLEAALYARTVKANLRVALRLYDDDFAAVVFRTLRAAHPDALTRSRSVSHLAAPAFAGAMMGRQILGAIPVERRVLVFAALTVAGHPQLEGRTIEETFRPGVWRILALDTTEPAERRPDLASPRPVDEEQRPTGLVWELEPGYVLKPDDRVVLAATRRGLAELHGQPQPPTSGR
ncbi:NAD-binding protein [Streptomyces spirodelae]|uniref:NAD-binding protein n=1 Tax=Streptomyces spirodelae TaxID=2812904 RepID=A0ABS3WLD4_9ACTN|nr:NAD(P)-binding protein [Streptomyces spirodelae]MBO8183927.1 NAD-binding protein [Streptomyces spirodelae]